MTGGQVSAGGSELRGGVSGKGGTVTGGSAAQPYDPNTINATMLARRTMLYSRQHVTTSWSYMGTEMAKLLKNKCADLNTSKLRGACDRPSPLTDKTPPFLTCEA